MKNILILCISVYQVFVVTNIKYNYYKDDNVDIILSNHTESSTHIYNHHTKNQSIFNDAYYIESLDYAWIKESKKIRDRYTFKKKHYNKRIP